MVPTSSALFWNQSPKEGLAWPSSQDREGGRVKGRKLFFSFQCMYVCVFVCVWGVGVVVICVVSVLLETAGCHKGVCWSVTVPCKHPALTLCVVCQRLEGCHAVGMVCMSGDVMSRACSCCG